MIEKLYIECVVLVVATRVILAGALWIAASVALGGCASQPHAGHALPPASITAPAAQRTPGFRVVGPHHAIRQELSIPDRRGEGDLIQWRLVRCERDDHDAVTYRSSEVRAPYTKQRHEPECNGPRRVLARVNQAASGG